MKPSTGRALTLLALAAGLDGGGLPDLGGRADDRFVLPPLLIWSCIPLWLVVVGVRSLCYTDHLDFYPLTGKRCMARLAWRWQERHDCYLEPRVHGWGFRAGFRFRGGVYAIACGNLKTPFQRWVQARRC